MTFIAGASRTGTHAVTRSVSALGDYPDAYAAWIASVKNAGGIATALNVSVQAPVAPGQGAPGMQTVDRVIPAARYPATVWVPLVNAHKWPLPDHYSRDGNWGYYLAPDAVAGVNLSKVKPGEVKDLPWTDALMMSLKKVMVPAVLGAGAVYLAGKAIGGFTGRRS